MRFFYSTCLILALASLSLAMDSAKELDTEREAVLASIRNGRKKTEPIAIPTEDKKASSQTRTLPIRQRRSFENMTHALSLGPDRLNSPHSY